MSITSESIPFYEIADISGLQTALDAKANVTDLAAYVTIDQLTDELGNYIPRTGDSTITGTKSFSNIINTNGGLAMRYGSVPTGTINFTTMYADATGRLSWKNGIGFTRTFDAGSITANRSWTMPDSDTTLAGLAVAQTFTAQQIFGAGTYTTGNSFFGNNTAIINSVGKAGFGIASGLTATLTAQGDGTNPIAIFQNSTGTNSIFINATATQLNIQDVNTYIRRNANSFEIIGRGSNTDNNVTIGVANTINFITGTTTMLNINAGTIQNAAGNGNLRVANIVYNINNTGLQTGTATGIFLNATETALNGLIHNLIDLQVGGVSRFRVANNGAINTNSSIIIGNSSDLSWNTFSKITSGVNGNIVLYNNTYNDFNRLQFGGTTNLFPALKRSSASLEARLADDSAYTNFRAQDITGNRIIANSTIVAAASTASIASLNIPAGVNPTTPSNGDIWQGNDDNLYIRIGGATRRFSLI